MESNMFCYQCQETAGCTGIILTKLDGTAKGGIVIAIKDELGLPVKQSGLVLPCGATGRWTP